ncbi:CD209 antigen-like protein E [Seriola lalandi dorsalis]|uniref:CD209 antigen-like protein E n=1 Tax=Seriola lalandi dorsalis TaxID=1841481 RepID=UPI000C6F8683|nr:CD209 antigen-like protein E [Seriola lalandi dorsalis]
MEEIYSNVPQLKPVNPKPSTNPTGPSSERRFHGVVLILGLLSVFLLVGLISLGVRFRDSVRDSANLTERLQASDEERDLLIANLTKVTKELTRLQRLSKQKKTCPAGWRMFSGTCYLLSIQSASWEKAREDCRARGADLVIIDSLKEQEFLTKDIIKQESWIGLTDRNHEKTWKWIDGTPLTLKFWQKGQPDKGNGSPKWGEEDCAVIQPGMKADENWNDLRCDAFRPWICGKKLFSIK